MFFNSPAIRLVRSPRRVDLRRQLQQLRQWLQQLLRQWLQQLRRQWLQQLRRQWLQQLQRQVRLSL